MVRAQDSSSCLSLGRFLVRLAHELVRFCHVGDAFGRRAAGQVSLCWGSSFGHGNDACMNLHPGTCMGMLALAAYVAKQKRVSF
jgi:hypothetical protein